MPAECKLAEQKVKLQTVHSLRIDKMTYLINQSIKT